MIEPKRKLRLGLATLGILIILVSLFGIFPLARGVVRSSGTLELRKAELSRADTTQEYVREFRQFSSAHMQDFQRLETLFIDPLVPVEFIQFLEQMGEDARLDLSIAPSVAKKEKGDPWPSIEFVLSGAGEYAGFSEMLRKLEHAPYLLQVQSLSVQKDLSEGVRFSLRIKVFTK